MSMSRRVENFYENKTIFLTGCTGLLGKILLEKLLRSFPNIKKIIVLIRPKRISGEERIRAFIDDVVFSRLDPEIFAEKVVWLQGEMTKEKVGLSHEDLEVIKGSVNIIFHLAATVRFNEPLKDVIKININGTNEILQIAKESKQLDCFIFVSTAYSNCHKKVLEEKLYPNKLDADTLLAMAKNVDDDIFEGITSVLMQEWPNTYTFSKNVAENLANEYGKWFPVGIFRPSAIIASYKEPFPSWCDKSIGTNFVPAAVGLGTLRTILTNTKGNTCMVPVDMAANALIAMTWDVHLRNETEAVIYNYTADDNYLTFKNYIDLSLRKLHETPFTNAVSYPWHVLTPHLWLYRILVFLLHTLPGSCFDFGSRVTGRKQKFGDTYRKLHGRLKEIQYFTVKMDWTYPSDNVDALWQKLTRQERENFYFDIKSLDWEDCLSTAPYGIKKYLLKEDMSVEAIEEAKKKFKRLKTIHIAMQIIVIIGGLYLLSCCSTMFSTAK